MIERHDADAPCAPAKLPQRACKRIGVEPFDRVDTHVQIGTRLRLLLDMRVQSGDKGVVSLRQYEIESYNIAEIGCRGGGGQLPVGDVTQPSGRLQDNIPRSAARANPIVEDAIDCGGGDPRLACNVDDRGAQPMFLAR